MRQQLVANTATEERIGEMLSLGLAIVGEFFIDIKRIADNAEKSREQDD